ncbi:MAG: YraN family protein [Candidatus Omnitrophota bacterium]
MQGRENKKIGRIGEEIAAGFLKQRGYKIIGVNIRTPFGEIDIVAKKNDVTIFVEVKTRTSSSLGPPHLSITWLKQKHLIKNALCYMKRHGRVYSDWRIDVVSVKLNSQNESESIELIENAVEEN